MLCIGTNNLGRDNDSAETHTIVMRSMPGTVREITTRHDFARKPIDEL